MFYHIIFYIFSMDLLFNDIINERHAFMFHPLYHNAFIFSLTLRNSHDKTLLYLAVEDNNLEYCSIFIKKGADINFVCPRLEEDILERNLLQEQQQIKHRCNMTPLMIAAWNGNEEICEFLIIKGADVNKMNNFRETALIIATIKGFANICKLLIHHGADVNIKDEDGFTALIISISISISSLNLDIFNYLVKRTYLNLKDNEGQTALIHAVRKKQLYMTQKILKLNPDISIQDNYDMTALMWATILFKMENEIEMILYIMLCNKKVINMIDNSGGTVLHMLYRHKFPPVMIDFISSQMNPDVRNIINIYGEIAYQVV